MLTSVRWLNKHLSPGNLTPDEAEEVLTNVGLPIEDREMLEGGSRDVRLDVELTSNRGDCLCHLGLARDIAAVTGRKLVGPAYSLKEGGGKASDVTSVENRVTDVCPRFTARVIKGVRVGPSPAWLREALESIGQQTINNVVDVSNYVLHEIGHPNHVFDLNKLSEKRLIVRRAKEGEKLTALDRHTHTLKASDLVVADAERAVSLAGVIGGLETGVTEKTTDVLLEAATWDPATIRATARRLGIRTDAGYRFERIVDARDLAWANERCAALIAEVAGGQVLEGMIDAPGRFDAAPTVVTMRVARCRALLGVDVKCERMIELLSAIGFKVEMTGSGEGEALRCVVPNHRPDVRREVDVIEEVARLNGYEAIRVSPRLDVELEIKHPAAWANREKAMARIGEVMSGLGFFETVTFSFVKQSDAEAAIGAGLRLIKIDEERRKDTPYLRPSVIPSLLTCRRANQDARNQPEGGVRLFETGATFAERDDGTRHARDTVERRMLAVLADAPGKGEGQQDGLRLVRGAIESVARALGGADVRVEIEPQNAPAAMYQGCVCGAVKINGKECGHVAVLGVKALAPWGLDESVAVGEVDLGALIALYPAKTTAHELAQYPGIERDLSVVVDERVTWSQISQVVRGIRLEKCEGHSFVGTYRGKQVGPGKKSVTLRLHFRDAARTLRHEEVDPQVAMVVSALEQHAGALLRK